MTLLDAILQRVDQIGSVRVRKNEPLANWTRFRLGGPCAALLSTDSEKAYAQLLQLLGQLPIRWTAIAGGTNLIAHDAGYAGLAVKFDGANLKAKGTTVWAQAGAELNHLVDFANAQGLAGFESMAGIPGWVGAAVYGNAGAYGQSISDHLVRVRFVEEGKVAEWTKEECAFVYRGSKFKADKRRQILSAEFSLSRGDSAALAAKSAQTRATRDAKFPPTMMCAGSIFKNLMVRDLPAQAQAAVPEGMPREGKVPSAWFLEQVGAKGLRRGGIQVAEYHANLLYNTGGGTSAQFVELVTELKAKVGEKFGFQLEEEVQYLGGEAEPDAVAELRRTSEMLELAFAWPNDPEGKAAAIAEALRQKDLAVYGRKLGSMILPRAKKAARSGENPASRSQVREEHLRSLALLQEDAVQPQGKTAQLIMSQVTNDLGQLGKLLALRRKQLPL